MKWIAIILIGVAAGVLSGLLGIGGGTVLVPLFLYIMKMDIHTATGTSLAVIIPTTIIGALSHHFAGQVDWKAALIVAILAAIGVYAGVKLNVMMPPQMLQKVFAVFLFFIAVQLFFFHK
ncbi:MAG: sulfite exporter TauE/SafE family protein [Candidatus Omnitrophica bacterium]|nr:sulfite exporter TauE/SafE family protein [Candidatus Omnitrophota bacterium]